MPDSLPTVSCPYCRRALGLLVWPNGAVHAIDCPCRARSGWLARPHVCREHLIAAEKRLIRRACENSAGDEITYGEAAALMDALDRGELTIFPGAHHGPA